MRTSATLRACYFRLGEQTLAVTGEHLRQVVVVGSVTRVPRVGPELLGFFSVRGAILPLIDLRPLLGLSDTSGTVGALAALIEHEDRRIALSLDEVLGFFPVEDAPTQAVNPKLAAFMLRSVASEGLSATLIDVGRIMSALERQLVVV